jgi:predicted transporter
MGFILEILLEALLATFVGPLVDPLVNPIARRYNGRLSRWLLGFVWLVTVILVWVGVMIGQRWTSDFATQLAIALILGMPFFAFVSTLPPLCLPLRRLTGPNHAAI